MTETKQKPAAAELPANEIRKPLEVSDDAAMACYANCCRVTSAPEEVIVDFGLTQEEAAREIGVSVSTAERLWSFARAWLFREMQSEGEKPL